MKEFIKKNKEILLLSLAISFMVFIHEQINIYSSNIDDIWFDLYQLLPLILVEFIVVFLAIGIVLYLIKKYKKKLYKIIYLIIFSLFVSLYIEGNFLTKFLPSLEGNRIIWSDYTLMMVVSLLVWILPLVIVFFLLKKYKYKKIKKISIYTTSLIVLMLFVSLISMGFRKNVFDEKGNTVTTKVNIENVSRNKNFIVIMLDTMNGYDFDKALKETGNPNMFDDFTYYSDAMSLYPFTKYSVPHMLIGEKFLNQYSYQEYINKGLDNSKLLDRLEKENYTLNLYMQHLVYTGNYSKIDNITPGSRLRKIKFVKEQAKITMYKFLPYVLKRFSHIESFSMDNCNETPAGLERFFWGTQNNYERLKDVNLNLIDQNYFGFYHFEGGHVPFDLDKDFNYYEKEDATELGKETAALKLTGRYLEKLKASNAYDNSIIIILSDHGYNEEGDLIKRGLPLLLIKGYDEHHKMINSKDKVSFDYLMDAYMDLLDNKKSTEIFKNLPEERYYYTYNYNDESVITEYKQTGANNSFDTIKPTGKKYIHK